jgi:hypothetical protein
MASSAVLPFAVLPLFAKSSKSMPAATTLGLSHLGKNGNRWRIAMAAWVTDEGQNPSLGWDASTSYLSAMISSTITANIRNLDQNNAAASRNL